MTKERLSGNAFVLFIMLFTISLHAQNYGVASGHHNMNGAEWMNNEICELCHTPHNANQEVPNSQLWNHQVTQASFTVYSSQTLDAVVGQPNGTSKLCLSCHDGTVAIENHGSYTQGTWYMPAAGLIGTELRDDHPISFIYDAALAAQDDDLYDPTTTPSGLGGTIEEDLLSDGYLQCTSCHDIHLGRNTQGCMGCHFVPSPNPNYEGSDLTTLTLSLWKDNYKSALCLTCHKK